MNSEIRTTDWRYVGHCVDGQRFLIEGVDISERAWRTTKEPAVEVEDPVNHQPLRLDVWEVDSDGQQVRFAAGESSNCVWSFYRRA